MKAYLSYIKKAEISLMEDKTIIADYVKVNPTTYINGTFHINMGDRNLVLKLYFGTRIP